MTDGPIAATVLTGFLGAGKTTFLNRLLKDPDLVDTAVIINEFGAVGIDHLLVEQASEGIIELSGGCLCCTVRGDLVDTLADLVDRVQTGRIGRLARVVIETTGLADPVPVLRSLMGHPALAHAFRLDGVIAMVDAVNAAATLDAHEESVRQVAVADRIVLTKTDLAGKDDVATLRARLKRLNPGSPILEATRLPGAREALIGAGLYDPRRRTADVRRWLGEEAHAHTGHDHHHDHEHEDDHEHDHHHPHGHDARFSTFSLVHPEPLALATVDMFLDLLRATHGERLLRLKGIIELADDPDHPLVVHGVQRLLHPPARLPGWPDSQRGTRIVLIGIDLDAGQVERLFAAFVGRPQVDTPDRAALLANPLSVPGFRPA